jgi:hypothetical protein
LDQATESCQIARRARVERLPRGDSCVIEFEYVALCEHSLSSDAGLCDDEVGEVGVAGGDGAVNEVTLLGRRSEIHPAAPAS